MSQARWLLAAAVMAALLASPCVAQEGDEAAEADHTAQSDADSHGDAHAAPHAGGGSPDPLHTKPELALWTLVVFFGLLAVLRATAWGPIVKALEAREQGIEGNLAAAATKHEEAKQMLADHEAKMAAAADDVRGMLDEARRDAEATKTQIVAEARDAADAERQRALRDIDHARDGAIKGLAEQSATLAVDLAAKVIRQDISTERQSEITREALGRMVNEPSQN